MLMGFDEYPQNVKVGRKPQLTTRFQSGWREAQSHFNEQLRLLRASGSSDFLDAFYSAVRFVNLNRVQTGIENYGYGRYPSFTEPVNFIALIDFHSLQVSSDYVCLHFHSLILCILDGIGVGVRKQAHKSPTNV